MRYVRPFFLYAALSLAGCATTTHLDKDIEPMVRELYLQMIDRGYKRDESYRWRWSEYDLSFEVQAGVREKPYLAITITDRRQKVGVLFSDGDPFDGKPEQISFWRWEPDFRSIEMRIKNSRIDGAYHAVARKALNRISNGNNELGRFRIPFRVM